MLKIRSELPTDIAEIRTLITAAFTPAPHYIGAEADVVDLLRKTGDMALSLVAEKAGKILGHVAFSPVLINGKASTWLGLGPISVPATYRKQGVAAALIKEGVKRVKNLNASGCVTMGRLRYYKDFGFTNHVGMHLTGAPTKDFLALSFDDGFPSGEVLFSKAFYCTFR